MSDNHIKNRPKRLKTQVCRYCKTLRPQSDMAKVPTNARDLTKWIEILGAAFAENLRHFKFHFICREHFKNRDGSLSRWPVKFQTIEEESEESSQKMEEQDNDCVVMVPPKREVVDPEIDGIVTRVNRKPRAAKSKPRKLQPNRGVLSSQPIRESTNSGIVRVETNNNYNSSTSVKLCRVCGVRNNEQMMTPVPTNPKFLQKWTKSLGSVFFENCLQNSAPHFVCMSHLRTIVEELCQE